MYRKAAAYALILTLATGCAVTPVNVDRNTKEPDPTASTISTKSIDETVGPQVEKTCPSSAEVRINELGMPNALGLLAVNENEILGDTNHPLKSDPQFFSAENVNPVKIEKIVSLDDNLAVDVRLSHSGLWMIIIRWHKNERQKTIWISSIDGKKQWQAANISLMQKVFWVSNNEILVVGVPNEAEYEGPVPEDEMRPLLSINPFTLETISLEPLPEGAIYVYGSYNSTDGKHYSIYYKDDKQERSYFLFDHANKASTQVFGWANSIDNLTGVGIRPNGLYFIERGAGAGVDFALDLSIQQIAENRNYNDVMEHLALENSQGLEITSMISNLTKSDVLILTSDPLDYEKPTPVFLFDYKADVLRDYCLDVGQVSTTISPDEQFVAFTVYEGIDNPGYHVLILNLETGSYSIIKDTKAIGFGKIQ